MLRTLVRRGLWDGLIGGSRLWMALGAFAVTVRLYKKVSGREPKVVYCEELKPGQTLVISHPLDQH